MGNARIKEIKELPKDQQEWFKPWVKWVIVIEGDPVGGYAVNKDAVDDLERQEYEYYEYKKESLK